MPLAAPAHGHLRLPQGARFHNVPPVNGREVTAEDVKFSLEVYRQSVAQGPILADVERIETPDRYTVTVKFSQPAAYFLQSLTYPAFLFFFAREAYERKEKVFVKMSIGTGPFVPGALGPAQHLQHEEEPPVLPQGPAHGHAAPLRGRQRGTHPESERSPGGGRLPRRPNTHHLGHTPGAPSTTCWRPSPTTSDR